MADFRLAISTLAGPDSLLFTPPPPPPPAAVAQPSLIPNVPALSVQVAFANNPNDPPGAMVWDDITQWSESLTTVRGRTHERSVVEAGTAKLRLWNGDNRFSPFNQSSPYYRSGLGMAPMKPMRVLAAWNLLTANQADLETGTTSGWAAVFGSSTLTASNAQALHGAWSLQLAATGAGDQAATTSTGTSGFAVAAGNTYSAMAWFKAKTSARACYTEIDWYDKTGAFLSKSSATPGTNSTTVWVPSFVTAVAPAGAKFGALVVDVASTGSGETHWVDQAGVFNGAGITTWMPGGPTAIFQGYIRSFPQVWSDVLTAEVDLNVTDGFVLLQQAQMPASVYYTTVKADAPSLWFRLGDPKGAGITSTIPGGALSAAPGSGVTQGSGGLLPFDATSSCSFNGTSGAAITANVGGVISGTNNTGNTTVECWITQSTPALAGLWYFWTTAGGQGLLSYITAWVDLAGNVNVGSQIAGVVNTTLTSSGVTVNDGRPHHIVVTVSGAGTTINVIVDGVARGSLFAGGVVNICDQLWIGVDAFGRGWNGNIQDFAIYNQIALTPAAALAHYQAGTLARAGESSGTRIAWAMAQALYGGAQNLEGGNSLVQAAAPGGATVLAFIQNVVDTENGIFYLAADGTAVFHQRQHIYTAPASLSSQVTFGDGPGEEPYMLQGTTVVFDDLDIFSEARITRSGGVQQSWVDANSVLRYGPHVLAKTGLQFVSDTESLNCAQWLVHRYGTALMRVKQLTFRPTSDPGVLWPQALTRDLQDRVTVNRRTPGWDGTAATMFSQQADIERITHTIKFKPFDWTVTYGLSPADSKRVGLLGDNTYGVLGSTAILAW